MVLGTVHSYSPCAQERSFQLMSARIFILLFSKSYDPVFYARFHTESTKAAVTAMARRKLTKNPRV